MEPLTLLDLIRSSLALCLLPALPHCAFRVLTLSASSPRGPGALRVRAFGAEHSAAGAGAAGGPDGGPVLPSLPSLRDCREQPSSGLELKKGVGD